MAKVKPIPDGSHTVTPYLIVRDAARALEFYRKAFGAEEIYRLAEPGGGLVTRSCGSGAPRSCWPMSTRTLARSRPHPSEDHP
jgi:hypothetical protein